MKQYDKIVFVDTDDTVRAPMAKVIMRSKELGGPLTICSRGLVSLFPQPVNQKAEAVLVRNGYTAKDHVATQLTQSDIDNRTLILTMEDGQKGKIWEEFEHALHVSTLPGYLHIDADVPALYGEPLTEYGRCYEAMEILVTALVEQLNEEDERL